MLQRFMRIQLQLMIIISKYNSIRFNWWRGKYCEFTNTAQNNMEFLKESWANITENDEAKARLLAELEREIVEP
jgi:hypothetical protein